MIDRRSFVESVTLAAGALVVSVSLPGCERRERGTGLGAFVRIDADGVVTVRIPRSEMGQGVLTSLAQLVAEELAARWSDVRAEPAPVDAVRYGRQITVASVSVHEAWFAFRDAGAVARDLLLRAAARRWGVSSERCEARQSRVRHPATGRSASFASLVEEAALLPPRTDVERKTPEDFRLIGRSLRRLDTPAKVSGRAKFGLDVRVPEMKFATIRHPPTYGGRALRVDDRSARSVTGVDDVFVIDPATHVTEGRRVDSRGGVVVVAADSWTALKGASELAIEWEAGPGPIEGDAALRRRLREALDDTGRPIVRRGETGPALDAATFRLQASYDLPYLAHATMEPMNCTAHVEPDRCRVWVPTQAPTAARTLVAGITGLPVERVRVIPTAVGGGFGRRSDLDYVAEAVLVARSIGVPVKLFWSREEDTRHDYYRPATSHRLRAGLDESGRLVAFEHHVAVGGSIERRLFPDFTDTDVDWTATLGAHHIPYAAANYDSTVRLLAAAVPTGYHRSVGHGCTCFAIESFIDEIASERGRDPVLLRREMLRPRGRARGVLDLAARESGWGDRLSRGMGRGVALFTEERGEGEDVYRLYVATVALVRVSGAEIDVERIDCAVDIGIIVNPAGVRAQIEGGVVFGLSAALLSRVTLADGRVQEENFDTFRILRMNDAPPVHVHLIDSRERPAGVGEKGVPGVAPAVANAIHAATGVRLRELPLRL